MMLIVNRSNYYIYFFFIFSFILIVPELQGEPDDIARDKCQMAVEKVNI